MCSCCGYFQERYQADTVPRAPSKSEEIEPQGGYNLRSCIYSMFHASSIQMMVCLTFSCIYIRKRRRDIKSGFFHGQKCFGSWSTIRRDLKCFLVATSHFQLRSNLTSLLLEVLIFSLFWPGCLGCFAATVRVSPNPSNRGICAKISDSTSSRCQVFHSPNKPQQLFHIKPNGPAEPLSLNKSLQP